MKTIIEESEPPISSPQAAASRASTAPVIAADRKQSLQIKTDLVVTSTHGRTGFKHALLGSVAEHVVRYAECPVIIVPSLLSEEHLAPKLI